MSHCSNSCVKFEFIDIKSFYTKNDSEQSPPKLLYVYFMSVLRKCPAMVF